MAGQIRITPDTMRERSGQFRTEASALGDVVSKLDSLLNQLQSEWEGEASRAFAESYNSTYRPNMVKAKEMVEEIAQALDSQARTIEEQDQMMAGAWRG